MRPEGYVARLGAKRIAYNILLGKSEGKRPVVTTNNYNISKDYWKSNI
jgi:hypothetical protein